MSNQKSYASQLTLTGKLCGGAFLALLFSVIYAVGATEYRLTVDGVTADRVLLLSFGHSVSNAVGGPLIHNDLRVVKRIDKSTPLLMHHLCTTQELELVRIEAMESTLDQIRYYAIRLKNVLVTSYSMRTTQADPQPTESLSLNYEKIEWTYIQTDPAEVPGSAISSEWDQISGTGGPSDPDSDGDGIPDSYEVDELLKPLTDDSNEDTDDDGMSNIKEFQAGTSAGDSNSIFKVTGLITPLAGSTLCTITFNSVAGRIYDLYASNSLTDGFQPAPIHTVTATGPVTTVDLTIPGFRVFVTVIVRAL